MLDPMIAASILSADFTRLGEEINQVLTAGADWIHFDVMDNHYVPNLTIGPLVLESIRKANITAPVDVHLMVEPVDSLIEPFAKAGADWITFHPEATRHVHRTLQAIKAQGVKAGLALNPATPIDCLAPVIKELDMILLMSVNPGFGGQSFIESTLDKIKQVRQLIDASGRSIRLEVDGGVNAKTIAAVCQAGADTFVIGSALFHSEDYAKALTQFRSLI